jgi:tryptophan 2,3-dioxygenase
MAADRIPSYWDYIRVEPLLGLQGGLDGDESRLGDDEVRFIVVHQIDELWFKLALRELQSARDLFRQPRVPETALSSACAGLDRIAMIFRLAAQHFELIETMRTRDYLAFRDKLFPASGFQSAQLREIEILLGLEDSDRIPFGHETSYRDALRGPAGAASPAAARVERRLADRPTLKEAVYAWLARTPIDASMPGSAGDDATVGAFLEEFLAGHRRGIERRIAQAGVQAVTAADRARLAERYEREFASAATFLRAGDVADPGTRARTRRLRAALLFIDGNRQLPLLSWPGEVIDRLVAVEQSMLVFRQRHARMVERVIGRRTGTGGSDGVEYLDRTALAYRVFKELWATRTLLLEAGQAPRVEHPDYYELRAGD